LIRKALSTGIEQNMPGPQITIDLARIEKNARIITDRCAEAGIGVFGVTKGTCGMPQVARAMLRGGVVGLAESRFENIRRLRDSGIDCPIMLLRSPPLSRAEEVVRTVDISLQSELTIIREISRVAERLGRVHDMILMIDLGDLREGIWPSDLLPTIDEIQKLRGVRIAGVGTNLSCLGAIIPTRENLSQLEAHAYKVERITGMALDWVSGGNSSSLPLLLAGGMPKGINNLRIGEAILLGGRETLLEHPWDALDQGAFQLTGELLEVKVKPSLPIGVSGVDAFGNRPNFVDEGDRLRAIANIGREDVIVEGMIPLHPGVRVIGASSDHLVLDITEAKPLIGVGDRVGFKLTYGALLAVMTSEYVEKYPMHDIASSTTSKHLSVTISPGCGSIPQLQELPAQLHAMGYEAVVGPEGQLSISADRDDAVAAISRAALACGEVGLIWIDSLPGLETLLAAVHQVAKNLSPENIVLVGLRQASTSEAKMLKESRMTVFTMVDIDAIGIREVMREAIRIAGAGTKGIHVSYSPAATEIPGEMDGAGGITARETYQIMEALANSGRLCSMDVSPLAAVGDRLHSLVVDFILSAFGKQIL
jgi:predicted amino acid racemase